MIRTQRLQSLTNCNENERVAYGNSFIIFNMSKMKKIFICTVSVTAVLALVSWWLIIKYYSGADIANIYVDSKLYDSIDLSKVENSYTIDIQVAADKHNIILVEQGAISMQSADCPDKLCVKQGKIQNGTYPIVCLPHKVIISFENNDKTDAVSR